MSTSYRFVSADPKKAAAKGASGPNTTSNIHFNNDNGDDDDAPLSTVFDLAGPMEHLEEQALDVCRHWRSTIDATHQEDFIQSFWDDVVPFFALFKDAAKSKKSESAWWSDKLKEREKLRRESMDKACSNLINSLGNDMVRRYHKFYGGELKKQKNLKADYSFNATVEYAFGMDEPTLDNLHNDNNDANNNNNNTMDGNNKKRKMDDVVPEQEEDVAVAATGAADAANHTKTYDETEQQQTTAAAATTATTADELSFFPTTIDQEAGPKPAGNKKKKTSILDPEVAKAIAEQKVTANQFFKQKRHDVKSRLCGDLTKYYQHRVSNRNIRHSMRCAFCGGASYTKCTICDVSLHDEPQRGKYFNQACFLLYHNDTMFGLARHDLPLIGKEMNEWCQPTAEDISKNRQHIKKIMYEKHQAIKAEGTM